MSDPYTIGGTIIGGLALASQWLKDAKDASAWKEEDLQVDGTWLKVALKKELLDGKTEDYAYMSLDRIPTAELEDTHEVVFALNEKKRIKYRLVRGRGLQMPSILVKKKS